MIKVSVVIPTYQRCNSVNRVLSALDSQSFPYDEYEVIVSIDGSQDGTKEMVMEFESQYDLDYIWEPNSGRAFACNRGIRRARGEVLIILDDDMEPSFEFIEAHFNAHSKNSMLGVMGAAPITIDRSSSLAARYIAEEFNSRLKKISDSRYKFQIRDFYGGNLSINLENILNVGGFDEIFKGYAHEDIELAYRLIKHGVEFVYDKDAYCTQHYEDSFRNLLKKTISAGKSAVLLYRMHPDTFEENELGTYNTNGWKWRSLRLFLIWSSIFIPYTNDIAALFVSHFGRTYSTTKAWLCYLTMDYSLWLGVWLTLRTDKNRGELISKIKSFKRR
jgi:glycosyltransferase involved in cell wall biosynthesis